MHEPNPFQQFMEAVVPGSPSRALTARLRGLGRTLSIEKGRIAKLDRDCDQIVYVFEGATKLVAQASGGREQVVAFHFAGDLVSVPARALHSYALTGLMNTQVLAFPAASLVGAAVDAPLLLTEVLERSMAALHRCRDKAVGLGRKSARERVASFLTAMCERIGTRHRDRLRLDLPMSRRDIGDSLGLTIETISRQFGELRASGLIETTGRSTVDILDPVALAGCAGHFSDTVD